MTKKAGKVEAQPREPKGTPTTKFFDKDWKEVPASKSTYAVTIWHDKDGNFTGRRIGTRVGATP